MSVPAHDHHFIQARITDFVSRADHAWQKIGVEEDALHDFRVALRYLRSWLQAYQAPLNLEHDILDRLANLTSFTNPCRDMEVYLDWLKQQSDLTGQMAMQAYVMEMQQQLMHAREDAVAMMTQQWPAIEQYVLRCVEHSRCLDSHQAMQHLGQGVLVRRLEKLSRQVASIIAGDRKLSRRLHQCRISIKYIRYLLEPFSDGNSDCKQAVHELKKLQESLGHYHDYCVFCDRLQLPSNQKSDVLLGALYLRAQQHRDMQLQVLLGRQFSPPVLWLERLRKACVEIAGVE